MTIAEACFKPRIYLLQSDYNDDPTESLKAKIDNLKDKYPQIISEPEPIK